MAGHEDMALIAVERSFAEPQRFDELQARETEHGWCLETHNVKFCMTYFSRDRKRMICLYRAPDAESVRKAQTEAGMPFERIYPVEVMGPQPAPQPKDSAS